MTDITDEQRAAVEWARSVQKNTPFSDVRNYATSILDLLPSELTNPQPVLPTEPDYYISDELSTVWMLRHTGEWLRFGDGKPAHREFVLDSAPFTRLVPERPQITAAEIDEAWLGTRNDASIPRHLDGSISAVNAFRAGFRAAIENGADRD